MRSIAAVASVILQRGQFVVPVKSGKFAPDPTLKGTGGVVRKAYTEWPPRSILVDEDFDLVMDGGVMGLIGDRPLWLELRDGKFRMDLFEETHRAEVRMALNMIGHPWE